MTSRIGTAHTPTRFHAAIIAATILILAAGCGGTKTEVGDGAPAQVSGENGVAGASDNVKTYFEAEVSSDLDKAKEALAVSEPGSIAAAYAQRNVAVAQAGVSAGETWEDDSVKFSKDKVVICDPAGSTNEDVDPCAEYTEIKTDGTGKLQSFLIDGQDIAGRISIGSEPIVKDDVSVQPDFAYRAVQGGNLFIGVTVTNNRTDDVTPWLNLASYVGPDGRQRDLTSAFGPSSDLAPGATATYIMDFGQVDIGGTVRLEINHDSDTTEFEIPT